MKELEAQLRLSTAPTAVLSPDPTEPLNTDNEFTVDALATNAFDEVPQHDIGYFGENPEITTSTMTFK